MEVQFSFPHPALAGFIDRYVYCRIPEGTSLYALPSHDEQLVVNLKGRGTSQRNGEREEWKSEVSYLVGLQNKPVLFNFIHRTDTVTIKFKPGGIHRLLQLPMPELLGRCVPAITLVGKSIGLLEEQLKNCPDIKGLTGLLDDFFLRSLDDPLQRHPVDVVMQLVSRYPDRWAKVEDMASFACMGIRQFERHCLLRYGVGPKYFLRVSRFSKALLLKHSESNLSWTEIAMLSGYYDQNHMIKDFKSFGADRPSNMNDAEMNLLLGVRR